MAEEWQWQRVIFPITPAIEYIAGINPSYPSPDNGGKFGFWYTLPRGSDKSSVIARICNWCLCFSKNHLDIRVAAKDLDQAKIIRNAMESERRLNLWFGDQIRIDKYAAHGPSGDLEILTADAGGAYGLGAHLYICDELTHWDKESMFTALHSGFAKVDGTVFVVITNAGYYNTWQHDIFLKAQKDKLWHVWESSGQIAGWVNKAKLQSARDKIPAIEAQRLYDNLWVESRANAIFTSDMIEKMGKDCKQQLLNVQRFF